MRNNRTARSKWGGRKNGGAEAPASGGAAPRRKAGGGRRGNGNGNGNGRDPKQTFEHYVAMAKAAASSGDVVESEKYYQYADHFLRLMKATAR